MRKLALLVGGLTLVMATMLAPKPAMAINCQRFCAIPEVWQGCLPYSCGVVCDEFGWPCTCGCIQ